MQNIHSVEILSEEVIRANELTTTSAATLPGITQSNLSNILHELSDISPEMCYRIAAVFMGELQAQNNLLEISEKAKSFNLTRYRTHARI